ncbi:MAG: hypothetical protein KatS3mg022_3577 [Armatimonadota bacterium]|nr:MAG: hypothetical protein KatS3mg022_3577 [Armatimonadota bacterium]GIV20505.1 MAG: hypothetical protein KatS3mg023_2256 [Armatimonadota bacterium]GIV22093.1 MAG: hypothetical protein KatS3mg023_3844 [Armatimonadota bacterium]
MLVGQALKGAITFAPKMLVRAGASIAKLATKSPQLLQALNQVEVNVEKELTQLTLVKEGDTYTLVDNDSGQVVLTLKIEENTTPNP